MWAFILVGAVIAAIAVGGGNTVEGFGEDVENSGQAIERSVDR